jgi:hypothetical protein
LTTENVKPPRAIDIAASRREMRIARAEFPKVRAEDLPQIHDELTINYMASENEPIHRLAITSSQVRIPVANRASFLF